MQTPHPFWPLVRQLLGWHRLGPWPWLIWVAFSTICLLSSSEYLLMQPQHPSDRVAGLLVWCLMIWHFQMLVGTPLPVQLLGGLTSLEFAFTRAVDRAHWLRAERVAVAAFAILPLGLNLLLSPLAPPLEFDRAEPGAPEAARQQHYEQAFPGSSFAAPAEPGAPERLVIPHGAIWFAAWLVWVGTVLVAAMAMYWSLAYTQWQRAGWHHSKSAWRPWLGLMMMQAPFFLPPALMLCGLFRHLNPAEECFLLFMRHPWWWTVGLIVAALLIQPWTERNIRRMEFEFS